MFNNNIDFDDAHNEWIKNKLYLGTGTYRYICEKKGRTDKNICISKCIPGEIYCKTHLKMYKEGKIK